MNNTLRILLLTVLSFGIYMLLSELYFGPLRTSLDKTINQIGISHIITYLLVGIPLFLGTILIHHGKSFLSSLGLDKSIGKGMLVSLIFTLPMFLGFAIVFEPSTEVSVSKILTGVLAAAFFEELYFRGFLFGQLFRFTKIGFIPSIIIGAIIFASAHLYQSQEFWTLVGVFLITFMGAVLFAWIYVEWNYNLWVPIFLHLFMNLSWMLFSVSDNALGGTYANVFRVVTIALAIIGTLVYKRRNGLPLEINKATIWMKNKMEA